MSDADIISAMRRKAGVGRPPPDVQPLSPAKALRIAAAKAAEDTIGLVLQVLEVSEEKSAISRLPGEVPEHALLSLLEGPENAYGLAIFDRNTVAAIVEQQTVGRVLSLAPDVRPPTATDSVMCAPLCDRMLRLFEAQLAELPDPPAVAGYHTAAQLREARSIAIAFDDVPYRLYRLKLLLGREGREGEILLIFPHMPVASGPAQGHGHDFGAAFQEAVMKTEARLDTVLHRVSLTLSDVAGLQEGMMIPIPREALSRVELRAGERLISRARLGQINGKRALRVVLTTEDDDALEAELSSSGGFDMAALGGEGFPALSGGMQGEMGMEGDLPALGDLPAMGELPPLGDLPPLEDMAGDSVGGFPAVDGLPPLGDGEGFPAMGELPALE